MSMKNEHLLERINQLEAENTYLKRVNKVCEENLNFKNKELSLVTQQMHYFYKQIGSEQASNLLTSWNNSVTKRVVLDSFNVTKQVKRSQEASGEDITDKMDERSCEKHNARQEDLRAWEES